MKKKQVYTPLFDTEEYVPKATCLCCGKSVKETLINNDGICIECVMNNIINSDDTILKPNEKLFATFFHQYEQYLKTRPKNNALVGLVGATFGLLAATVTSLAAHDSQPHNTNSKFDYINKKITLASFEECNHTTVVIRDESWICPCCNTDNYGAHFCKICGVYPKFKLED